MKSWGPRPPGHRLWSQLVKRSSSQPRLGTESIPLVALPLPSSLLQQPSPPAQKPHGPPHLPPFTTVPASSPTPHRNGSPVVTRDGGHQTSLWSLLVHLIIKAGGPASAPFLDTSAHPPARRPAALLPRGGSLCASICFPYRSLKPSCPELSALSRHLPPRSHPAPWFHRAGSNSEVLLYSPLSQMRKLRPRAARCVPGSPSAWAAAPDLGPGPCLQAAWTRPGARPRVSRVGAGGAPAATRTHFQTCRVYERAALYEHPVAFGSNIYPEEGEPLANRPTSLPRGWEAAEGDQAARSQVRTVHTSVLRAARLSLLLWGNREGLAAVRGR